MPNPLAFDPQRVLANIRQATDEDLLDRATIYRAGMEPEALDLIDRELHDRGISAADIARHREQRETTVIFHADGHAAKCTFCHAPAVSSGWGWHRILGVLPLFPRYLYRCETHAR